jgi:4-diphosphocytidyl-2-C-methyl-D-erythritol kinase
LKIKDTRNDGFHNIESLFAAIDLHDTLEFEFESEPKPKPKIAEKSLSDELCVEFAFAASAAAEIPREKNLVTRALSLFKRVCGLDTLGVKIKTRLVKRIPLGGGLGGGSSDAASTLFAMNRIAKHYGKELSWPLLFEMGASLGSDVPFFLSMLKEPSYEAAWVTGRGEIVQPFSLPSSLVNDFSLVLVFHDFQSNTARAYAAFDAYKKSHKEKGAVLKDSDAIKALHLHPPQWPFYNDFFSVLREENSKYEKTLHCLKNSGSLFSGISGSGSTCFAIFPKGAFAPDSISENDLIFKEVSFKS